MEKTILLFLLPLIALALIMIPFFVYSAIVLTIEKIALRGGGNIPELA